MCRLLGLISKKPVKADYWFFDAKTPFKDFSEKRINKGPHNSGWGIASLEKGKWTIFKEGKDDVPKYSFNRIRDIKSKIILIHLRHASRIDGIVKETTKNAHPFKYGNWVFEHNGGVARKKVLPFLTEKFKKEIKTDDYSEVYFLLIMQFFQETKNIIEAIKKTLSIVRKYSYRGLNFLMSDGENLYAFRDVSSEHKDLYDYYCLHYLVKNKEVVVSSDPLTKDESWIPINLGELLIVNKNLSIRKLGFNFLRNYISLSWPFY